MSEEEERTSNGKRWPRCKSCGRAGHNAGTCENVSEPLPPVPDLADDDDLIDEDPGTLVEVAALTRRVRPRSLSPKQMKNSDDEAADLSGYERPRTRGDCLLGGSNEQRPCPWIGCKHHLFIDVSVDTGTIKLNRPDIEAWEMSDSCSLDIADRGGITLEQLGTMMNLTRERIRQVEWKAMMRLRRHVSKLRADD